MIFFAHVTINDAEQTIADNRLHLLLHFKYYINMLADFDLIQET